MRRSYARSVSPTCVRNSTSDKSPTRPARLAVTKSSAACRIQEALVRTKSRRFASAFSAPSWKVLFATCCLGAGSLGCSRSEASTSTSAATDPAPSAEAKPETTAPPPAATSGPRALAVTEGEVVVGQLHSATGTMAISETGSIQAERLAIDQINAQGGILGRKIRVIQEDGASDWPQFAEKSRKLLVNDRTAAVFGCWTSASRKAVLPVFEKEDGLLYYPTFYEGLEQSKNVFYTGQEATQQILAGLDWLQKEKKAKTFFLIGSD